MVNKDTKKPSISKNRLRAWKPKGSRKTSALTLDQFNFILDEFRDAKDLRMEIVCLLMAKCIRIGDVLRTMQIRDVYTPTGAIRDRFSIQEEKTGKTKYVKLEGSKRLLECLEAYYPTIADFDATSPLFYARKTGLPLKDKGVKKLLRQFVNRHGIEQCSPHSFRKFGARHVFNSGFDVEIVSQILNHSSVRETRTYLDVKPKEVEQAMEALAF